jgi:hypothetical protein
MGPVCFAFRSLPLRLTTRSYFSQSGWHVARKHQLFGRPVSEAMASCFDGFVFLTILPPSRPLPV